MSLLEIHALSSSSSTTSLQAAPVPMGARGARLKARLAGRQSTTSRMRPSFLGTKKQPTLQRTRWATR
eukprot:9580315-Lingulodinium_polyedra.AAC.1